MWDRILDIIFPKKCINCRKFGNYVCDDCFSKIKYKEDFACPVCKMPCENGFLHPKCRKGHMLDGLIPVLVANRITKRLVSQFEKPPFISELKNIIGELMVEGLSQNEGFYEYIRRYKPVVIAIPEGKQEVRKRGYSPSRMIASYVAQYFSLEMRIDLVKTGNKINFKNEFDIPRHILLIGDMIQNPNEVLKALENSGAKILGVAFI